MSVAPILLIGGAGFVGQQTAKHLQAQNPGIPMIIGGRDLAKAQKVAANFDNTESIKIDIEAADLGLGKREISAVAIFFKDDALAGLRFAQIRGIPHISISSGASEIAPEVAAFMHNPGASAVVLGAEWLVGAVTIPALEMAKKIASINTIKIGALLDEKDSGGPAAEIDMHRLGETLPAALTRKNGAFYWRVGENTKSTFRAIDGTLHEAVALSPYDVMGLATATNAANIAFDLAVGVTSSRRQGKQMSTEIIIEIAGKDKDGTPLQLHQAVFHPDGQMPLTALGVAMTLERLLGLDGKTPTPSGLYFPFQLLGSESYFARLDAIGGRVLTLDPDARRQAENPFA
ncbi:hypothetical protein J4E05_09180 [Thalassospira sp. NFXS8]|uniref:hypothetical protein n=1 Tax=Thalassospira sp. NFXS8 TaxID=2819093 RepID=UPI0032E041DF